MASTLSAKVLLDIEMRELLQSGVRNGAIPTKVLRNLDLTTGTSDGNIDLAYYTRASGIGESVTTVYDLAGSLADLSGTTITFVEVVLVVVVNLSGTAANYLEVGPDATNGFGVVASNVGFWADASDRNVLSASFGATATGGGAWLVLHDEGGVAVAAGSTDELAVITQGGTSSNTWDILILGRSA